MCPRNFVGDSFLVRLQKYLYDLFYFQGNQPHHNIMADVNDQLGDLEADPAAEFLAREQSELAGLEDDLEPAVAPAPIVNGKNQQQQQYHLHMWPELRRPSDRARCMRC